MSNTIIRLIKYMLNHKSYSLRLSSLQNDSELQNKMPEMSSFHSLFEIPFLSFEWAFVPELVV